MIIDFNRYNGGGSGSGSTDLTNYWNSAVTEQHIESAATEVYSSAVSYTDAALADISLDGYYTSAQTDAAIAEAVSGKADAKIMVDFDHTTQAERAAVYAELKALYDGGSGATINKNYDFYKTVNTWQGQKIDYYTFSGGTLVFGQVVSPENLEDQVAYVQVMEIDSAGNVTVQTNTIGAADMSGYYTSAQTEEAISAATSGKADAANVTANTRYYFFPTWNEQGIITGASAQALQNWVNVNDGENLFVVYANSSKQLKLYTPLSAGTAGDILVSTGSGAPVWSAVTMPDMSEYTPTSGFSTINGSAITEGGNLVIQGGGDMSGYWNSAETKSYVDSAVTGVQDQIDTMDEVVSQALVDLNEKKVESQDVKHIVKLTQSAYDQLATKDPDTFYIIVNSN